ncbi:cobalt-precorrin-5B (C(1))-methyltransferase [Chloroflexota bacterium]
MAVSSRKSLRQGYTTGACAAAAAKAAALALLRQKTIKQIQITLPQGEMVDFDINTCVFDKVEAKCLVIKDAGDDPDVTHGAEIGAILAYSPEPGITITGGEGVGKVTKPGLEMPVGMPAINKVPHQMIVQEVNKAMNGFSDNTGLKVIITVPRGEELAKKTLNRRLGIIGGISILGTTGIVIPYSINAYKASISQALDIAIACGCHRAVLTTGRRSEKYAQGEFALPEECFVQAGDFIGYSLEECAKRQLKKVIIWGMTGKISKLAAGHFYTNISDSRVDFDFLSDVAAGCGIPEADSLALKDAVTANHFRRMLSPEYVRCFCDELCQLAADKCQNKVSRKFEVSCIMSDYDGNIIGRSDV